jgi:hypothetical protein
MIRGAAFLVVLIMSFLIQPKGAADACHTWVHREWEVVSLRAMDLHLLRCMSTGRRRSEECLLGSSVTLSAAADKCFDWQRLQDGKWFRQCQDERSRQFCFICPTREVTPGCIRREGSKCAI